MAFCQQCGAQLPEGSAFCGNCGAEVSGTPQQKVCRSCGHWMPLDMLFCDKCGNRYVSQEPQLPFQSRVNEVDRGGMGAKDFSGESITANYFKGIGALGGTLVFDQTGMTFCPHQIHVLSEKTRIQYQDICHVAARNTMGLVPNGMSVFTRDGKEHKFVLFNRENVIAYLNQKRG
ncbi:zinc-ribbon domain-containing protein [Oscillospiraceae bacterium MB08-C2-2]|nr:zinc-ribbon domain-containing protein [Oscillospiraceae bacterium MB08-C2-2]